MKDLKFESFQKFVAWGAKKNEENPGKFGTIEMYMFLVDGCALMVSEELSKAKDLETVKKSISEKFSELSDSAFEKPQ